MKYLTKRTVPIISVAIVLVICAAIIVVLQNRTEKNPYANDPDPKVSGIKIDSALPSGTHSPTQIMKKSASFASKEVTVRGLLIQTKEGKVYIADQKDNNAVTVDISAVPDSAKYVNDLSDASSTNKDGNVSNPVSVTGVVKVLKTDTRTETVIVVSKITP